MNEKCFYELSADKKKDWIYSVALKWFEEYVEYTNCETEAESVRYSFCISARNWLEEKRWPTNEPESQRPYLEVDRDIDENGIKASQHTKRGEIPGEGDKCLNL